MSVTSVGHLSPSFSWCSCVVVWPGGCLALCGSLHQCTSVPSRTPVSIQSQVIKVSPSPSIRLMDTSEMLLSQETQFENKREEQMLWWLTFKCKITKITLVMSLKYTSMTQSKLCLMCSNHAPLNYSGWESKSNLRLKILTYLWPWNMVKVIKPGMKC